ncbi:MAG: TrkH family potassium uptake protein [Elusimicrobiota bacterium]
MAFSQKFKLTATQVISIGFVGLILVGTLALFLPFAAKNGFKFSFIDALFTSTSAVCVTGLVVVDIGENLTLFGQIVVLLLIQLGGLGYMTISTLIFMLFRQQISIVNRLALKDALQKSNFENIFSFVLFVVKSTIIIELIGSAVLAVSFIPKHGFLKGIYYSVFHAVAAFCNAGFSLYSTNLLNCQRDLIVNFGIIVLIIIGGIGFPVLYELIYLKKQQRVSLQTKIVVVSTIALVLIGTVLIFYAEAFNQNTDIPKDSFGLALTSLFQSVTARTAGFNTVNIGAMTTTSLVVLMGLMFIGASPSSTGGGIKTVTFTVIVYTLLNVFRGKKEVNIRDRRIPDITVMNALIIFVISILWCIFAVVFINIADDHSLLNVVFEVISAFGTVGLSVGNPQNSALSFCSLLSEFSKIVIILTMFIGRVGFMTIGFAMLTMQPSKIKYPEEQVNVG